MQILLLTPALPYPPHQGGALRNFGIFRGLHAAGHKITLVSFNEGSTKGTPLPQYCQRIETVEPPPRSPIHRLRDLLLTRQPDLARRLELPEFRDRLRAMLAKTHFDLVQFEGLEMAIYLPLVRQLQPHAKLIYDAHNAEYRPSTGDRQVESGTAAACPPQSTRGFRRSASRISSARSASKPTP